MFFSEESKFTDTIYKCKLTKPALVTIKQLRSLEYVLFINIAFSLPRHLL